MRRALRATLALYLLTSSGTALAQTWENESPLATHVGNNPGNQFGWIGVRAGDIDDDGVEDYLISAPFLGAGGKGRVNVYSGASGAKIRGATGQSGETLGWSGSAAGELDGDSFAEYMAGAPGSGAGAAYVWSGVDGAQLFALIGEVTGDRFGAGVTFVGDVDGDLIGDLGVGAPLNDTAGANAGRAYVHSGADGSQMCIKSPHYRLGPPQATNGNGVALRVLDFTQPPLATGGGAVLAGTTWYFQLAYRDPTGPAANRMTFSDGLAVTLQP